MAPTHAEVEPADGVPDAVGIEIRRGETRTTVRMWGEHDRSTVDVISTKLVGSEMRVPRSPPAPVATVIGEPREVGGVHHVGVQVVNNGGETAANVQVTAVLTVGGEATTADQTIDFLAGREETDLVFVFADDPALGDLSVVAGGFERP